MSALFHLVAVLVALGLSTDAGAAVPEACTGEEHRQFDYWLGDWNVYNRDGRQIGTNRVTLEQGGCVLHEHWRDMRGGTGESFNIYDRGRKVWHQTWVAATGNLLLLDGGLRDGSMVLSGEQVMPDGKKVLNRIAWVPQEDGSIHQAWEQSLDDGETWKTGFLGIYRRKAQD